MEQLRNWSVCQICARCIPRDSDPEWLDELLDRDPAFRVVRCPIHWSNKAMRRTPTGRTKARVEHMYRMRIKYADWPDKPLVGGVPLVDALPDGE
jgi:hypothetical protein